MVFFCSGFQEVTLSISYWTHIPQQSNFVCFLVVLWRFSSLYNYHFLKILHSFQCFAEINRNTETQIMSKVTLRPLTSLVLFTDHNVSMITLLFLFPSISGVCNFPSFIESFIYDFQKLSILSKTILSLKIDWFNL